MTYHYRPRGVCSQLMEIKTEGDRIVSVSVTGGCPGNLQGISRLVEGREIDEVISLLSGIRCSFKDTSCPDQLARALRQIKEES